MKQLKQKFSAIEKQQEQLAHLASVEGVTNAELCKLIEAANIDSDDAMQRVAVLRTKLEFIPLKRAQLEQSIAANCSELLKQMESARSELNSRVSEKVANLTNKVTASLRPYYHSDSDARHAAERSAKVVDLQALDRSINRYHTVGSDEKMSRTAELLRELLDDQAVFDAVTVE